MRDAPGAVVWPRVAALGLLLAACEEPEPPRPLLPQPELLTAARPGEPLRPLPAAVDGDPRRVALGRDLFFEPALSRDRGVRCVDCHPFEHGGADPRPRSIGTGGQVGAIQAPSVFNLAYDHCYNWDGRICDLAEQAPVALYNPAVMGMTEELLLSTLAAEKDYAARFAAAYPDGLTVRNLAHAIASYEYTLVTPNSPVDRWLRGDDDALSPDALAGYRLFKDIGCVSCHQGTNVGGNLFQPFGVFARPLPDADIAVYPGRSRVTRRPDDRGVFRVPSLRNVGLTAPYFHNASAATLSEAVQTMARVQLGQTLDAEQVRLLVAFLSALTGDQPEPPHG